MNRTLFIICSTIFFFILLGLIAGWGFGLRINSSPSLPMGIWQISSTIEKGHYVTICVPSNYPGMQSAIERHYFPEGVCAGGYAPLLKKIVAVAGDSVILTPDHIAVNGNIIHHTATLYKDSLGRPLKSIDRITTIVKPGEFWVITNEHPRSFDSRYFGAIPRSAILHSMRPVLLLKSEK